MYLEMFLRIFSDCCLFFALLGCCPSLLPYSYPLPAVALIFGISAAIASFLGDKGWKTFSFLCALLPFSSLLLASSRQEMLILILPILYTCSVILRSGVTMEYYNYNHYFKRALAMITAAWAIISLVIYFEDPKHLKETIIFTDIILQYTLIFFLCGVILQRQLRLGARHSQGGIGQIASMLGCVGMVGLGFVLTEPFLRSSSISVLQKAAAILIAPFMLLLDLYSFIIDKLKRGKSVEQIRQELENSDPTATGGLTPYQQRMQELIAEGPQAGHSPWVMIVAILVAIIILILMVFAFTKLSRRKRSPLIVAEASGAEKKRRLPRLSNRNKVRQAYRDFLRFERGHGLKIQRQYTTADILARISQTTDEAAASDLREVYLRARYDERAQVKNTQVSQAKDALKRIRKF